MASSTPDITAMLGQMSSFGISPQRLQAATHNPYIFQEIMAEIQASTETPDAGLPDIVGSEIVEEIRRIENTATRERDLPPEPLPILPRFLFIQSMVQSRKKAEERIRRLKRGSEGVMFTKAFVGTEKYFSQTPIHHLARISLRDMLVRKVHRGKYFLCRVIIPPTHLVAIEAGVEDPEGYVRLLSLYNFPSMAKASLEDLDSIFPVGTILAIREPFLKMSVQTESAFVRVDSPSDVVFLNPGDPLLENVTWTFGSHVLGAPTLPSTMAGWKDAGNKHFKAGRWLAATVAYTKGLSIQPSDIVLHANRAEAYLKLEYYSAALFDAEKVLESLDAPGDLRKKALFRAGKAEYGRGSFEAARVNFKAILENDSENRDALAWMSRTDTRVLERKYGQYDWLRHFLDSQSSSSAMDIADYVGPIKVVNLPGRGGGRGVVAARNIQVGELLAVAKPFSSVFPEELQLTDQRISLNLLTKRLEGRCQNIALFRTVDKIWGNPELHGFIYQLCPGPPYSPCRESYPPPVPSPQLREPLECGIDIDMALLENITSNNRFRPQPLRYADFKLEYHQDQNDLANSPSALYLLPSLFNHACAANAERNFFRDVMVIRATANVIQGEEIMLEYTGDTTAFTRQKRLDSWHFRCMCFLCEEDRADGEQACRRRDELVISLAHGSGREDNARKEVSISVESSTRIKNLKRSIKQISDTYAAGRSPIRPALASIQQRLAHELQIQAMTNRNLYHQAIVEEIKGLEAVGIRVSDKSTDGRIPQPRTGLPINTDSGPVGQRSEVCVLLLMIVASFLSIGDTTRGKRWLRAAWWLENITVGGGRALFEERYKKILKNTGIIDLSNSVPA